MVNPRFIPVAGNTIELKNYYRETKSVLVYESLLRHKQSLANVVFEPFPSQLSNHFLLSVVEGNTRTKQLFH
jgi:hypothetical protein